MPYKPNPEARGVSPKTDREGTCPPKFGIMLFVQYVTGVGGGGGWRIEPAIGEPAVTCAA